ncbi:hypothetical protein PVAND_002215 [Polypedilum vanderplanki]|uniref:Uncharacterized protein n=1 Tax=Polypedilum vanderplanki TaxID=319348 RepID=A0A9J6BRR6_POLVA|nr:hypothetical protein PVAND_002215 [Polypedilum vanderplanki]
MEFIAPNYTTLPSNNELKQLLELYNEVYGRVKRKVGITLKSNLFIRYTKKSVYKKLTNESVFCGAINSELAVEIETRMMVILREQELCANPVSDFGTTPGAISKDGEYYVYLIEKKDDEDKCHMCGKVWIQDKEQQKKHMEEFHWEEVMVFTQAIKDLEALDDDNSELIAEYKSLLKWQHLEATVSKPSSVPEKPSTSGISKKSTLSTKPSSSSATSTKPSLSRKRTYSRIKPPISDSDSD